MLKLLVWTPESTDSTSIIELPGWEPWSISWFDLLFRQGMTPWSGMALINHALQTILKGWLVPTGWPRLVCFGSVLNICQAKSQGPACCGLSSLKMLIQLSSSYYLIISTDIVNHLKKLPERIESNLKEPSESHALLIPHRRMPATYTTCQKANGFSFPSQDSRSVHTSLCITFSPQICFALPIRHVVFALCREASKRQKKNKFDLSTSRTGQRKADWACVRTIFMLYVSLNFTVSLFLF